MHAITFIRKNKSKLSERFSSRWNRIFLCAVSRIIDLEVTTPSCDMDYVAAITPGGFS